MAGLPQFSGREFYNPNPKAAGQPVADYDRLQSAPELPSVPPPSASSPTATVSPTVFASPTPVDTDAPDVLKMIQGCKFKTPFNVTLMRRTGTAVFKTDAGTKSESSYEMCKETIRDPSDILRLTAAVRSGAYKPLNENTLEFQLMLYLAHSLGVLVFPQTGPPG